MSWDSIVTSFSVLLSTLKVNLNRIDIVCRQRDVFQVVKRVISALTNLTIALMYNECLYFLIQLFS